MNSKIIVLILSLMFFISGCDCGYLILGNGYGIHLIKVDENGNKLWNKV